MPFDANLMFFDGSVSIANTSATSLTRTLGHAVLDLKETGAKGVAVVIVVTGTDPAGACEMQPLIQCSDTITFPGNREEHKMGGDIAPGHISNNDIGNGGVFMRRVSTKKRYMRVKISGVSNGGFFGTTYIYACPYPFDTL